VSGDAVVLQGEYDISNAAALREQLDAAVDARPGAVITVDMGAVTFFDSSAISALATAYKRAAAGGGGVTVAAVPDRVRKLFELTGLDEVLLP
jgi:anti-sigma B factor antagonist